MAYLCFLSIKTCISWNSNFFSEHLWTSSIWSYRWWNCPSVLCCELHHRNNYHKTVSVQSVRSHLLCMQTHFFLDQRSKDEWKNKKNKFFKNNFSLPFINSCVFVHMTMESPARVTPVWWKSPSIVTWMPQYLFRPSSLQISQTTMPLDRLWSQSLPMMQTQL